MKTTAKTTAPKTTATKTPAAPHLGDLARAVESAAITADLARGTYAWANIDSKIAVVASAERSARNAQTVQAARVASAEAAVAAAQAALTVERQRAATCAELATRATETAEGMRRLVEERRAKADAERRELGF